MELKPPAERIGNRDKILRSATHLFYHVGYQATSIEDILKQSGVHKSNFYYHFTSKEELAAAVLDIRFAEYEELVARTLRNPDLTPDVRMAKFMECVSQAQVDVKKMSGCPFGNFAATLASMNSSESEERFRQRLSLLFNAMERGLQDCLTEGMEKGYWRTDIEPADMAAFLNATIQGLLMLTKTHRDTGPLVKGLTVAQKLLRCHITDSATCGL